MAGPSRRRVDHVHAAARHFVDDVGICIVRPELVRKGVPVVARRTQVFPDPVIEVVQEAVAQARAIGQRRDVAILIGPLIHGKGMEIAAVDVELVDHFRDCRIGRRPLVRADHGEGLILQIALYDAVEHILYHAERRIQDHAHGISVLVRVFHVLASDIAHALQLLHHHVALRHLVLQPRRRSESEFVIKSHIYTPFVFGLPFCCI